MNRLTKIVSTGALALGLALSGGVAANAAGGAPSSQTACSPAGVCWDLTPPSSCNLSGRSWAETHSNRVYYYSYYGYTQMKTIRPGIIKKAYYFTVSVPSIPAGGLLTLGSVYQYCD